MQSDLRSDFGTWCKDSHTAVIAASNLQKLSQRRFVFSYFHICNEKVDISDSVHMLQPVKRSGPSKHAKSDPENG